MSNLESSDPLQVSSNPKHSDYFTARPLSLPPHASAAVDATATAFLAGKNTYTTRGKGREEDRRERVGKGELGRGKR